MGLEKKGTGRCDKTGVEVIIKRRWSESGDIKMCEILKRESQEIKEIGVLEPS